MKIFARRGSTPRWQAEDLIAGVIGLQDLLPPLADLYNLGFFDGRASLADLAEANSAADRYYRRAFEGPTGVRIPDVSFSELSRRRGEHDRARAAETDLLRRFRDARKAS